MQRAVEPAGTWPGWALEQQVEELALDPWPGETTLLQLLPFVAPPAAPRAGWQPASPAPAAAAPPASAAVTHRRTPLPWFTLPLLLLVIGPPATALVYAPERSAPRITVPLVIGESQASARASLQMVGLSPEPIQVTARAPAGAIVSQLPAPGSRLPSGATVDLLVARGVKRPALVPQVSRAAVEVALRRLRRSGLDARIRPVNSALPVGTVVAQAPRADRRPKRGAPVLLAVSKGRALRAVPSLAHLTGWQAYQLLRRHGFRPLVREIPSGGRRGLVIAQFPVARTRLPRGAAVTMAVARRPPRPARHPSSRSLVAAPAALRPNAASRVRP